MRSQTVSARVKDLKESGQDFEWYPTTDEIILQVATDYSNSTWKRRHSANYDVLDIGAGDGRVLLEIERRCKEARDSIELYAIEKSAIHLERMPKSINVIGTDFEQQTLADKPMGMIFCNPPYSQYEEWTLRILREGSAEMFYLVIPVRWRESREIARAIEAREVKIKSLGEFDFENADRSARARVEVIRFEPMNESAFDSVIASMLPDLERFDQPLPTEDEQSALIAVKNRAKLIDELVESYNLALQTMLENYQSALRLDVSILKELGVEKAGLLTSIRGKIATLKNRYWSRLFDELHTVRNRLATKQRKALLSSLNEKHAIDFTANNIYSVLIWVSKWSNDYFDEQLIGLFTTLSRESNVVKYKSNQRTWGEANWRYRHHQRDENSPTHYRLEYRFVVSYGGISTSQWDWERTRHHGLTEHAFDLVADILTIANNLGYTCNEGPADFNWEPNKQIVFHSPTGQVILAVRAFKNGNMHFQFDPSLMLAINIEAGRLLGWLRSPQEAATEMELNEEQAAQAAQIFGTSFRITGQPGQMLLGCDPEPVTEDTTPEPEPELVLPMTPPPSPHLAPVQAAPGRGLLFA